MVVFKIAPTLRILLALTTGTGTPTQVCFVPQIFYWSDYFDQRCDFFLTGITAAVKALR